ncbi:MAG: exo-alpha-sialidase [Phycisphaerales bacterium]|nr:exo-alpha-sialidase [Phycisphaerales bacterium]
MRMARVASGTVAMLIGGGSALAQLGLPLSPIVAINDAAGDNTYDWGVSMDSDGAGNWVALWTTDRVIESAPGGFKTVVSRSGDDGATWSAPAWLSSAPTGAERLVQVRTNRAGRWMATWGAPGEGGTDVFVSWSDDGGVTWGAARSMSGDGATGGESDAIPMVAGDAAGRWVAVWRRGSGATLRLVSSRSADNGQTWSAPIAVTAETNRFGTNHRVTALETDGMGRWITAWSAARSAQVAGIESAEAMMVVRSSDAGATWEAPEPIMAYADAAEVVIGWPSIATDRAGNWMVCWSASVPDSGDIGSYDIYISPSDDHGTTWQLVRRINTNSLTEFWEFDLDPVVASAGSGRWAVAWKIWRELRHFPVYATHTEDDGENWTPSESLSPANPTYNALYIDDYPVAVGGVGGKLAVAWNSRPTLGGPAPDSDILMRTLDPEGGTWGPRVLIDPTSSAEIGGTDREPSIAMDGAGHAVALWTSDTMGEGVGRALSGDYGRTWHPAERLAGQPPTENPLGSDASIATDSMGTWVACWPGAASLTSRAGVLCARSTDQGANWTAARLINSPVPVASFDNDDVCVAATGSGSWVVVWSTNDQLNFTLGGTRNIFYQRSADNGENWGQTAWLNSDAEFEDFQDVWPRIACSRTNVCIAVWSRSAANGGAPHSLMMARSEDGGVTWQAPVTLSSGRGDRYPVIATDHAGGWVIATVAGAVGSAAYSSFWSSNDGASFSAPVAVTLAGTASAANGRPGLATDGRGSWVLAGHRGAISSVRSINGGRTWSAPRTLATGVTPGREPYVLTPSVAANLNGDFVVAWPARSSGANGIDIDLYSTAFSIPDCNGNGVPDPGEIASGALGDCDGNGLPDRCEIDLGNAADCDGDGVPDPCQIAQGVRRDLNRDGVPDVCQCAPDYSGDGLTTIEDVFLFLNAWFARTPAGDFNHIGGHTTQDIFDFLQWWFEGC